MATAHEQVLISDSNVPQHTEFEIFAVKEDFTHRLAWELPPTHLRRRFSSELVSGTLSRSQSTLQVKVLRYRAYRLAALPSVNVTIFRATTGVDLRPYGLVLPSATEQFIVNLPDQINSGVYAVLVESAESKDFVIFYVRQRCVKSPVALVLPTFTYLAYANERQYNGTVRLPEGQMAYEGPHMEKLRARKDIGISLYDAHSDGSGTVYSSAKRPILNMRPDYLHWYTKSPRGLSVDLHLIGFLDRELGLNNYDIITHHEIEESPACLDKYSILVSGSHPQYQSASTMAAWRRNQACGGSLMYPGGGGWYWFAACRTDMVHRLEVRRGGEGCRTFTLPPGERFHSLTGEQGGLWRSRSTHVNEFCGLGSIGAGTGPGCPYTLDKSTVECPELRWLWRNVQIDDDYLFGLKGLAGRPAAGDEIDCVNMSLGTPPQAIVLGSTISPLSTTNLPDDYSILPEEINFPVTKDVLPGGSSVRADLVFYEISKHQMVLAAGSLDFTGPLAFSNYENPVAQLTANFLHRALFIASRGQVRRSEKGAYRLRSGNRTSLLVAINESSSETEQAFQVHSLC